MAAMLFVTTYVFMLRLQSEALPISKNKTAAHHLGQEAVVTLEGEEVVLRLERRKNWQNGSVIRRKCWCDSCSQTCPIHVVWKFFSDLPDGAQPFAAISYQDALMQLRGSMAILGVKAHNTYGTQDLRRGHAQDLKAAGASEDTIRLAGQWKGRRGPMPYMDIPANESEMASKAHANMEARCSLARWF